MIILTQTTWQKYKHVINWKFCSTTEQFLLNNDSIYEAKKLNGSLVLTYRDYQKACDSIFHKWLVWSLHLAMLVDKATKAWLTVLDLQGKKETTISDLIRFLIGIFEGDILLQTMFTHSVNLLSHLLN